MITLNLRRSESELIKDGLKHISEQRPDAFNVCWDLIHSIEAQESDSDYYNDYKLLVNTTAPADFLNIKEI